MLVQRIVLCILCTIGMSWCRYIMPMPSVWEEVISKTPMQIDPSGVVLRLDPPFKPSKYLEELCLLDNSTAYLSVEHDTLPRMLRPRRPGDEPYRNVDYGAPDSTTFLITVFAESSHGAMTQLSSRGIAERSGGPDRPGVGLIGKDQWLCFDVGGLAATPGTPPSTSGARGLSRRNASSGRSECREMSQIVAALARAGSSQRPRWSAAARAALPGLQAVPFRPSS